MLLTDSERLDILFASIARGDTANIAERKLAAAEEARRVRQQQRLPSRQREGREHNNVTAVKKRMDRPVQPEVATVRSVLAELPEVRYIRKIPDVAGSFRVGVQEASRRTKEFTAHVALHADGLRNYKRKEGKALGLRGQEVMEHFLEEGVVLLHTRMPNIANVFREQVSQIYQRRSVRYA